MALTSRSIAAAAKCKSQRAQAKVRAAEHELQAASEALRAAIPEQDPEQITAAAERTTAAELDVHEAAQELEGVNHLLDQVMCEPPSDGKGNGIGKSGCGSDSLIPHLSRK
jgi:hypothetical protein